MYNYSRVIDIAQNLISSVDARDVLQMQKDLDKLELAYKQEFGNRLDSYEAVYAYMLMNLSSAQYFAFNNMFGLAHARFDEVEPKMDGFEMYADYTEEQKNKIRDLYKELKKIHTSIQKRHLNRVVGRYDTRCCLCRIRPANKTGSHMVPNFLSHPTFSWDGKGKRFHEALNHHFLNELEKNCTFYGREVPDWRFAKGEGKEVITEEDIEKNVNQLEFDNEFCSECESRFGLLESAYSQYYNGQKKKINSRLAYLFWLSVLWRMSMGSMSIFMDMKDELSLRKLLNDNILGSTKEIENSEDDLGDWKYAIFRAEGLKEGDKGILGYRKECSPYVVMYNDLVMVFYHCKPNDKELNIGPIKVKSDNLNDWTKETETSVVVSRRWFWDVRDWLDVSSYDYYDPIRERTLIKIREKERSEDRCIPAKIKEKAVKKARISNGPRDRLFHIRKMERICGAWIRLGEANEKGEYYNPLFDDELFLQQKDFDNYYTDLAAMSRFPDYHDIVPKMPFYSEARKAIPEDERWEAEYTESCSDTDYVNAYGDFIDSLTTKELNHLMNGVEKPYINPFKGIGRNDLCPCGSGKKFKNCCGRVI